MPRTVVEARPPLGVKRIYPWKVLRLAATGVFLALNDVPPRDVDVDAAEAFMLEWRAALLS